MEQDIRNFNTQFSYKPEIVHSEKLRPFRKVVVAGMGGSHLAADVIKNLYPFKDIRVHREYGLPAIPEVELPDTLIVASSYSGNTEETMSAAETAFANAHNLICIATGGALIAFAEKNAIPYIRIPDTGIQPRLALGFSALALSKALGDEEMLQTLASLASLDPSAGRKEGEEIASMLAEKAPIICTSENYTSVGYNWKIKFNETAKIPAFWNVFPELNHNEMQGFGGKRGAGRDAFLPIFLAAKDDHPRVLERMEITEKLYQEQGLTVLKIWMSGERQIERIFNTLLVADWAALTLARASGVPDSAVPMVESFKKMLK